MKVYLSRFVSRVTVSDSEILIEGYETDIEHAIAEEGEEPPESRKEPDEPVRAPTDDTAPTSAGAFRV